MTPRPIARALVRLFPALASALALVAPAGAQDPPPADDAVRTALVERVAQLVQEHYVFPDVAQQIAARLREKLVSGVYDRYSSAYELASALTRELQSINGDERFKVRVVAPGFSDPTEGDAEAVRRRKLASQRRQNFGFRRVEVLEANVGYLDLRTFADARVAGTTAVAAMAYLAHVDALIIDLRQNSGGSPSMVQLITSYFFEEPTHLSSFEVRGQEQVDQFWTQAWVPGPRMADTPLFVLVSPFTGSAAEEFAYNLQSLGRATLIGQTTAGAAHPGDLHPATEGFAVFISDGRAINPLTVTNWEGVGVDPDIHVHGGEDPLTTAHLQALRAVDSRLPKEADRSAIEWATMTLVAKRQPFSITVGDSAHYAGGYQGHYVWLRGEQLLYVREGRPEIRMFPMAADLFSLEALDSVRLRFERDEEGRLNRLIVMHADGRREEGGRE